MCHFHFVRRLILVSTLSLFSLGIAACGGGLNFVPQPPAPSYSVTAAAFPSTSIAAGGTTSSVVTITPVNGYTGTVSLSCNISGAGTAAPTCSFSPDPVIISGTLPAMSVLTISTSRSTTVGNYAITITAIDGKNLPALNGSQKLNLITSAPSNYTLDSAPPTPSPVSAGLTSNSAITITPFNGYTGTVSLSCVIVGVASASPACSFNPNPVLVNGSAAVTSTLTISTTGSTPGGTYQVVVGAQDAASLAATNGSQTFSFAVAGLIEHVVVIFQENRTPDNLFQDPVLISRGADIASAGLNSMGQTIPLTPIDLGTNGASPQNYDLGHSHADFVAMYHGGKMDSADRVGCTPAANCPPNAHPNPQFKYVNPADVQPYFAMAEQYTFGDRMFQTNQGPSFPAHQFIFSGTSAPTATSNLFASDNTAMYSTGCIAPPTATVMMIGPTGSETEYPAEYPCFEHPTLSDLLDAAGVTWRYYTPMMNMIWTAPNAIEHICQQQDVNGTLSCTGPDWKSNVIIPEKSVLQDIAAGKLAQVSWIMPDGSDSDHALMDNGTGPSWVASIVNSIGNSPYWANTAIVITWDDWGGWYDHVAPTVINDGVSWGSGYVYGFRVPLIVVSPYSKAAYISHETHDFGSILKFVESTFNLPSLGYADANADDLSDCFALTQSPLTFQTIAAPLNAAHFMNDKSVPVDPDDD
jgi:phospholipase C